MSVTGERPAAAQHLRRPHAPGSRCLAGPQSLTGMSWAARHGVAPAPESVEAVPARDGRPVAAEVLRRQASRWYRSALRAVSQIRCENPEPLRRTALPLLSLPLSALPLPSIPLSSRRLRPVQARDFRARVRSGRDREMFRHYVGQSCECRDCECRRWMHRASVPEENSMSRSMDLAVESRQA